MAKFRGDNTINGKEGKLFLDGEEVVHVKTFTSTAEKVKNQVNIMGRRWVSNKTSGIVGTGSMTVYYVTSKFRKMLLEYSKTGKDVYFTLQGVLDDPGADRGKERVTLYDVNIDSAIFGSLDVETGSLEEEVPFTFEGADLPESLKDSF